jgi:hypothetical protein
MKSGPSSAFGIFSPLHGEKRERASDIPASLALITR